MSFSPLRILVLNYEFPPMGGGAGHASFKLSRQLVSQGYTVDVITSRVDGQAEYELINGVGVFRVNSWRRSIQDCGFRGAWSYVFNAAPLMKRLLNEHRYDVIHYFFGLPTGALSLLVRQTRGIPSVVSLRGSDVPGYDSDNRLLQAVHRILMPCTRRIWKQAGAIVALSESLRDEARATMPDKPIAVIGNAIDSTRFRPSDTEHPIDADDPVRLLTVARLVRRKGLDELLQALTLLEDLPLHLTIQGTGRYEAALQKAMFRLGLEERVTFSGFRVREHLPEVYQAADIFIMPSHSESFGLAVLEAMSCGLPVIVSRIGGMVDYVKEGVNGSLVPAHHPEALAAAIRRLATNAPLRREMGRRNAALVKTDFTWERVAHAYEGIYRSLAPVDALPETTGVEHAAA